MLPYRENGVLKYATSTSIFPSAAPTLNSSSQSQLRDSSDDAPLVAAQPLSQEDLLRFTATGRPMPTFKPSALQNLGSGGAFFTAPQHLPQRYTDESIIPVVVKGVVSPPPSGKRRRSLLGKLTSSKNEDGIMVVYMPRGEYLKYFARDEMANYIGTEEEREWTREELDERFGKYKKSY